VILGQGRCDVWVAPVAAFAPYERRLDALLPPTERAHVQACRGEAARLRARLSRSLLRLLLARYLNLEPHRIDLERRCPACGRPHGKPRLRAAARLEFSVSHSADLLVFAFDGTPVGVDVEPLANHPWLPSPELVEMALTPAERRRLDEAPVSDRWAMFLRYWTGKEAVLKQLGTGLSVPLHDVTVHPPGPVRKAGLDVAGWAGAEVWVRSLNLGETRVGAIATAGRATEPRMAQVPPTLAACR
jgi:4'-phosphopantetheinyl transferase